MKCSFVAVSPTIRHREQSEAISGRPEALRLDEIATDRNAALAAEGCASR